MGTQIEKIEKRLLGVTGKYYVAAELGKRNIYAQLTFRNQKRTDLSIFSQTIFSQTQDKLLKVEVKCKQGDTWPNCKGINSDNSVIVFVDFEKINLTDRPTFYILDRNDWSKIMTRKEHEYRTKHPDKRTKIEENVIILLDEVNDKGKPYSGWSIKIPDIEDHKESWDKIIDRLN